jgi:hypothetical protein
MLYSPLFMKLFFKFGSEWPNLKRSRLDRATRLAEQTCFVGEPVAVSSHGDMVG